MDDFEKEVVQAFKDNNIRIHEDDAARAGRVIETVINDRRLRMIEKNQQV